MDKEINISPITKMGDSWILNKATGKLNTLKTAKKNGLVAKPEKFDLRGMVLVKDGGGNVRVVKPSTAKKFMKTEAQKKFITDKNSKFRIKENTGNLIQITQQYLKDKLNVKLDKVFKENQNKVEIKVKDLKISTIYAEILQRLKLGDNNIVIKVNNTYITLNKDNIAKFRKIVKGTEYDKQQIEPDDSFKATAKKSYNPASSISIERVYERKQENGAFFNYYTSYYMGLENLQIYDNIENSKDIEINCLIYSLEKLGLENNKIEHLKTIVKSHNVPKIKLKKFCEDNDFSIRLKTANQQKNREGDKIYGNNKNVQYKLNLLGDHYFMDCETKYTSYAIKNYIDLYEEFKDSKKDFNDIIGKDSKGNYRRDKKRFIRSYDLVKLLLETDGLLKDIPYNDITKTTYFDEDKTIETLEFNIAENTKLNEYKERENFNAEYDKVFFDFETYDGFDEYNYSVNKKDLKKFCEDNDIRIKKQKSSGEVLKFYNNDAKFSFNLTGDNYNIVSKIRKHKPYLCVKKHIGKQPDKYYGVNCGKQLLQSLTKDTLLIAHNSSYDWSFLNKYLWGDEIIMKGKKLISGKFKFTNWNTKKTINIIIKDSLSLIPAGLGKFGEMFKLPQEKEIMPYDIYNKNSIEKRYYNLDDIIKLYTDKKRKVVRWNKEDVERFIGNCKKWNLINDKNEVDIIEYSSRYCEMDCIVLENGYEKFREWIKEITSLDIDEYLTLPSVADRYLLKEGVYDGVYQLSGNPRAFIQKAVVGGRTMLRQNKMWYVNDRDIADFDGVSLYPSSMYRIDGYLKGIPKVLETTDYNIIKNYDGYFVEIKLNKINKKRKMPLVSYIADNKRNWVDDKNAINKNYIVDKYTLEDWIKFQKIEFEIIRGYYYDEGRNNKINSVIEYLFNKRKEKKADKNPIEAVYKNLMNSAYGKSILKPIDEEINIKSGKDKDKHISYHFDRIKEYYNIPETNKWAFKEYKTINNHFNNVVCGVEVLSMSKRIMNEVICCGEDNKLNMYYQDTDSIHMDDKQVKILAEKFKIDYGRDLIGEDMGQFHIDFKMKGVEDEDTIRSKTFIGVGKKCYIDVLEGLNDKGKIVKGFHIRLKGIPEDTIAYFCEDNKQTPLELFKDLHNGIEKHFDLLCGGEVNKFEYDEMTYAMKEEFSRNVSFKNENKLIK